MDWKPERVRLSLQRFQTPTDSNRHCFIEEGCSLSTFTFLLKCYPKKLHEGIKCNASFLPPTLKNGLLFWLWMNVTLMSVAFTWARTNFDICKTSLAESQKVLLLHQLQNLCFLVLCIAILQKVATSSYLQVRKLRDLPKCIK